MSKSSSGLGVGFQILLLWSLATGVSCSTLGDVPAALRVDGGEQPANQDQQVRFRTTYYFRIVDSCRIEAGKTEEGSYGTRLDTFMAREKGQLKIVSDSLYRFRMTGKASALFNKIHFESGVLRTEQIDPFGSQVQFDKKSNTFRVVSATTSREQARREEVENEILRLRTLKKRLKEDLTTESINLLDSQISDQIRLLADENNSSHEPKSTQLPSASNGNESSDHDLLCPDGRPVRRSYSLYGPEGVRHLDPDERLLMAMSSDSNPLIGMLQQLAGKAMEQAQDPTDDLEDFVEERSRISKAENAFTALTGSTKEDFKKLTQSLESIFAAQP